MEDQKKVFTVQVGENDEIVEVIDKIKNISGDSVELVIPDEAALLQDLTNLKILQKQAEQLGKEISISQAQFPGFSSAPSAPVEKEAVRIPALSSKATMTPRRSPDGLRPMSDMVRKGETVDLRNLRQEKAPDKQPDRSTLFPEGYARENYFSQEALAPEMKVAPEPLMPLETGQAAAKTSLQEEASSALHMIDQGKKDEEGEAYWRKLAEKKVAEGGADADKFEGIFDEHGRLDPDFDTKVFDFSYSQENSKRKKSPVLPTLSSRFFAVFILLGVLTAALALYFILPKAEVAVALKEEKVSGDFNLLLEGSIMDIDAEAGKVPVKTTEIRSEQTQAFVTTSKKHVTEKAKGKIVIYNECSTGPQTLVAGTRFLSQDGKVFKIEEAASIAGFTKPEDEIAPGQEIVSVIAEGAGESYNIGATSFTIPKLQELGSWKYSCLYARSQDAMTGGMDKEVAYVSQTDYDNAKATLLAAVQKENDGKISAQASDTEIYLSDQSDPGTVEEKSSLKVGEMGESFSVTVAVKKPVLSVRKSDMEGVLAKKILSLNTFENAQPVEGSLTYEVSDLLDKDGKLSIDVTASESFAFKLDAEKVKQEIAGRDKGELNEYFGKMNGIKSVSVNFWPFWVTSVPDSSAKINLLETSEL